MWHNCDANPLGGASHSDPHIFGFFFCCFSFCLFDVRNVSRLYDACTYLICLNIGDITMCCMFKAFLDMVSHVEPCAFKRNGHLFLFKMPKNAS